MVFTQNIQSSQSLAVWVCKRQLVESAEDSLLSKKEYDTAFQSALEKKKKQFCFSVLFEQQKINNNDNNNNNNKRRENDWFLTGKQFITAVAILEGTPWARALSTLLFRLLLGYCTDSLTCWVSMRPFSLTFADEHEGVEVKGGWKSGTSGTCVRDVGQAKLECSQHLCLVCWRQAGAYFLLISIWSKCLTLGLASKASCISFWTSSFSAACWNFTNHL